MFATIALALTAPIAPTWKLTLDQEFDGPKGTAPDTRVWARDLGGSGFGNNEHQSYTDGNLNAFLDGSGNLVIEARKEPTKGADGIAREYSSARLKTSGKFSQTYGKFEARIKLPSGKGIWPAFWMLGDDTSKVGWPSGGELDILEFIGHETTKAHGTAHGPGYSGGNGRQGTFTSKVPLDQNFHVFGLEWEPERIRWTLDGKVYFTLTPDGIGASEWVFDKPFFVILNLAVGGNWPGYPDATTVFPQRMLVDYVRVYKDASLKVDKAGIAKRRVARLQKFQEYKPTGPLKVPGTIALVDFLPGGPGKGYKDSDPANQGSGYRPLEGVDIGGSANPKIPYSIGWTTAGEWLRYEIDVAEAGTYNAELMVATEGPGGSLHFNLDGKRLTGQISVPDTGNWQRWQPVNMGKLTLPKGKHVLELVMDTNGKSTNSVGNLLSLTLTRS